MELKRYDEMESKRVIFSLQLKVSREYECIFHAFRVLSPVHSTATQLNSTRRRVELRRRCAMNTLYDAASASVTVGDRRPTIVGGSENFRTLRRN